MLRAELREISPNDYFGWEPFASSDRPEPWDDFGWFVLSIGVEGQEGSYLFQVLVATPAAVTRARKDDGHRRVLVVPDGTSTVPHRDHSKPVQSV